MNPEGFREALKLFREAAKTVPAYGAFLRKHKINPYSIKTYKDFLTVPIINKQNYLRAYEWKSLLPQEEIPPMISASSGSSGKPLYWPRGRLQEEIGGELHERIFKDIFGIKRREEALLIVCFSTGTWIAGAFTASSGRWVSNRGYKLSIITPGIEKEDIIHILRDFAPLFHRVILAGYPPFLRDVVEEARNQHIDIKRLKLNLLFAGENFSETWRKTMHKLCGIRDPYCGSSSIYGTADANAVGHETPVSVFLRKIMANSKSFCEALGLHGSIPTVVQYDSSRIFFEEVCGELVFTCKSGIPLVRYNIKDTGCVMSHKNMRTVLAAHGLLTRARKRGLDKWRVPFIFLGSRKDVAVTFYALNIYPENIKAGLEDKKISSFVGGKFIAYTRHTNNGRDQKFYIDVELARGKNASSALVQFVRDGIVASLVELNMEYRKLLRSIGKKALPIIKLVPYGDPRFTVRKSKHFWTKKN